MDMEPSVSSADPRAAEGTPWVAPGYAQTCSGKEDLVLFCACHKDSLTTSQSLLSLCCQLAGSCIVEGPLFSSSRLPVPLCPPGILGLSPAPATKGDTGGKAGLWLLR